MSASEERHILEAWHSNPLWKMKVDKMSDEQVIVKLDRLRRAREYRRTHHGCVQHLRKDGSVFHR